MATFKVTVDTARCGYKVIKCPKQCCFKIPASVKNPEVILQEHLLHTHSRFSEYKVVARSSDQPKRLSPFGPDFTWTDLGRADLEEFQWKACNRAEIDKLNNKWRDFYPLIRVKDVSCDKPRVLFVCCYCPAVTECNELLKEHIFLTHVKFNIIGLDGVKPRDNNEGVMTRLRNKALLFQ
jgi:hypothetical protein